MNSFRHSLPWWTGAFVIFAFLLSCTRSEFSTTHRVYRNGHYVNVNRPVREYRPGHAHRIPKTAEPNSSARTSAPVKDEPISYMASTSGEVVLPASRPPVILPAGDIPREISPSREGGTNPDTVIIIREKKPASSSQQKNISTNIPTTGKKLEVLGLIGFILSIVGLFIAGIPLGLAATILGGLGLHKFKKKPDGFVGKGFDIAAIIIGILAIVGAIIVLAI